MTTNYLDFFLFIIIIFAFIIIVLGFYQYYNEDKTICESYANMSHVSISYPNQEIVINNRTVSLNYIKQSCINFRGN